MGAAWVVVEAINSTDGCCDWWRLINCCPVIARTFALPLGSQRCRVQICHLSFSCFSLLHPAALLNLRMSTCSSFVDSQLKVLIGWWFYLLFCNLVNFSSRYHFPKCDWIIFFCSQNTRLQSSLVFIHALKEVNNIDVRIIHRYVFSLWILVNACDHTLIMGIRVQTWRHELDLLQDVCGSVSRELKAGIHPDLGQIVSWIELYLVIR